MGIAEPVRMIDSPGRDGDARKAPLLTRQPRQEPRNMDTKLKTVLALLLSSGPLRALSRIGAARQRRGHHARSSRVRPRALPSVWRRFKTR